MPAINVARTDTFEQQRVKINQIGDQIFNITQGGSDLSTGNLKLGDGTRTIPSLAFISDSGLGIYKPNQNTIGVVSSGKKIFDFSNTGVFSFKDFAIQQLTLFDGGLSIFNSGENYDPGSYINIVAVGGTGENATLNITVTEYSGSILTEGSNYINGSFNGVNLIGGSGTGARVVFDVDGISGSIEGGSSYIPGTYQNVPLTNISGSGTGAIADINITGNVTFSGSITNPGTGYTEGSYSSVRILNSPAQTFSVTAVSNPGTPPPNEVYAIDGVIQDTLTLEIGNTYVFDISDASNGQHLFGFRDSLGNDLNQSPNSDIIINFFGTQGQPGSFVQVILKPTLSPTTLSYYCLIHAGMGGTINIVSGTPSYYGSNGIASVSVDGSGIVTNFEFVSIGLDYKENDVITIYNQDAGGSGSAFLYTVGSPTYEGSVSSVVFTSIGQDYQSGDILSANVSDLGGQGSGFEYVISSDPGKIKNFNFDQKGSNYQVNDVLELPKTVSNISVNLPGQISGVNTTLSDSSPIISVASTVGLFAGMEVFGGQLDTGSLAPGTTIDSVDSSTQLTLSVTPTTSGSASLTFQTSNLFELSVPDASLLGSGFFVEKVSGDGSLDPNTTIVSIDIDNNVITLSSQPPLPGTTVVNFIPPFGDPDSDFQYQINSVGTVESVSVSEPGNGYVPGDFITVNSSDLSTSIEYSVKSQNLQKIIFNETILSSTLPVGSILNANNSQRPANIEIVYIEENISNEILFVVVAANSYSNGDEVFEVNNPSVVYTINQSTNIGNKFFIDYGNGFELNPNLTLYSGNTYNFDLSDSSLVDHQFSFSSFPGGIWFPSLIENVETQLETNSRQITVADTTNILAGMQVSVSSGEGILLPETLVESVDSSTQITLTKFPLDAGSAFLTFTGIEYTDGVIKKSNSLQIKITDSTPTLYYYCSTVDQINPEIHHYEGNFDGTDSIVTIDLNNPRVFGSGLSLNVLEVERSNVIFGDIETGEFTAIKIISEESEFNDVLVNSSLESQELVSNTLRINSISSDDNLVQILNSSSISGNLSVGSSFSILGSSGNLTTSGVLKTTNTLNVDDSYLINENSISTTASKDLVLSPAGGRIAKINSQSALVIPAGITSQRPPSPLGQNGAIRFNTDTNQYEGYSESSSSWSSLGGVRDLDGNTFILAEESVGLNDNTLWFYNDNINTVKFTPSHLEFRNVKSIRSSSITAPQFTNWTSNTPVVLGQYLKFRNNLYEVTVAGTTATSGNEPTHTTGSVTNGTAELTWSQLAVAPLTFEDIEVLRIGPLGGLPVSINNDLRLSNNVVSTDINDLIIRPNSGKKVIIDASTTLVLPSGSDVDRGIPDQGSIRFSKTSNQFEGYDGTNWGSLGGVKDVDQNTYIIPELSPGSNENILYFYNDNNNTLQLSTTSLDFYSIDTIRSVTSDELEITASLLTFDNGASTFDNTATDRTFLHTTKQYFDLGLSAGLTTDTVLRLDDQGDVYLNIGFGTGVYNGVKVLDGDLKEFELAYVKILTEKLTLVKGTSDNGSSVIYAVASNAGAKTTIVAENPTSGDKEFIEFGILDDGTDVFHTQYGNIRTGAQLIIPTFEVTGAGNVRINITLGSGVNPTEAVNITVVSNVTKK